MTEEQDAKTILATVVEELSQALSSRGFESQPLRQSLEKGEKLYWPRKSNWKIDMVTVWVDKHDPRALEPSLEIYLPPEVESGALDPSIRSYFHGKGVQAILGRTKSYFFPSFLGRLRPKRAPAFARLIVRDVVRALPWLETFSSPGECLAKLRAGETNFGSNRGPLAQSIERHLLLHSQTQSGSKES